MSNLAYSWHAEAGANKTMESMKMKRQGMMRELTGGRTGGIHKKTGLRRNLMKRRVGMVNFTLIELLVVVTIITIMLTLLLPALGSAKRTASKVACASNLKQAGSAIAMYQLDWNGCLPAYGALSGGGKWIRRIAQYLNVPEDEAQLKPVFRCRAGDSSYAWHYGYNVYIAYPYPNVSDFPYTPINISLLKNISSRLVMADSMATTYIDIWNYGTVNATIPYVEMRHSAGANFLFADSHVGWSTFAMKRPKGGIESWTFAFVGEE